MKRSAFFLTSILLTSCAYNYQVGVPKDTSQPEYTTMIFDNRYKVSKIDDEKFPRKFSMWVDGSHTVKLKPGAHTFTLRYSDVNMNSGGNYTSSDSVVSASMESGRSYEIQSDFSIGIVRFYIKEVVTPARNKP